MISIRSKKRAAATAADDPAPEVYPGGEAVDDHALHLDGQTCARCGRDIKPTDEARRTANGDCVHLAC